MIGVGNTPIQVNGRTRPLEISWGAVKVRASLIVIPTLTNPDVIVGMDLMARMKVRIDTESRRAYPTVQIKKLQTRKTERVPKQSSIILSIENPLWEEGKVEGDVLYEPGEELHPDLRAVPTLSRGKILYVRLDNVGDGDLYVCPEWIVGTVEGIEEIGIEEDEDEIEPLPEIPQELTTERRRKLQTLLEEFEDIFSNKENTLGTTDMIQHEIHTHGPPIRQPL